MTAILQDHTDHGVASEGTMVEKLKNEIAASFGTPCAVVDLDIVERNITRIQKLCDEAGVRNRPHIKTHKSPVIAKLQLGAGAAGITCQKIGEAEVMVDAGIRDILISYNLIAAARVGRLAALLRRAPIKVCADNPVTLREYSDAVADCGRPLDVLVECDTGRKRAGVETPGEVIELARQIKDDPNLAFAGLLFYPTERSWPETQVFHDEALAGLGGLGLKPEIVSTGGTPNLPNVGQLVGATEHRAGTYIFNDRMMMANGVAEQSDCALTIYTTVVSRAGAERGILDAGSKTLTSDTGGLDGFGLLLEHPQARIAGFAEEHGFLDLAACNQRPEVGEIVRVIPNHVCVCVNMLNQLVAVRGDEIVEVLPVAARGCLV